MTLDEMWKVLVKTEAFDLKFLERLAYFQKILGNALARAETIPAPTITVEVSIKAPSKDIVCFPPAGNRKVTSKSQKSQVIRTLDPKKVLDYANRRAKRRWGATGRGWEHLKSRCRDTHVRDLVLAIRWNLDPRCKGSAMSSPETRQYAVPATMFQADNMERILIKADDWRAARRRASRRISRPTDIPEKPVVESEVHDNPLGGLIRRMRMENPGETALQRARRMRGE